ncbi:MAG: type VI secretion system baseplate subunit TssF [Pyrinomonadaceae bacterium]
MRFYLNGEPQLVYSLLEMIFNHATRVELRPVGAGKKTSGRMGPPPASIILPPDSIRHVGFGPDEEMLPYTAQSFPGYRLLTEYFAFPEKYLFFDVTNLDRAVRAGFGDQFEIVIHLRDVAPASSAVTASAFQLGCSPIINLFEKIAEPIQLTQQKNEYHVIPDVHRQMATELYAVQSITSTDSYLQKSREFQPFYSFRHTYNREQDRAFWYASRRQSTKPDDPGTEIYLSLVDLDFNPHVPAVDTITAHTLCTNRDLPGRLPFGGREGDFEVEGTSPLGRVRCLKKPTSTLRPPLRRGAHWRLISHLSLNHLSLVQGGEHSAPEALREILMLYDFMDSAATRKQINGITKISSRRVVRQTGSRIGTGFVRGVETAIEFDEEQYIGSGIFLFATVLERFLALYVSVNSFSQLIAQISQREGYLKRWPPRAGNQILL